MEKQVSDYHKDALDIAEMAKSIAFNLNEQRYIVELLAKEDGIIKVYDLRRVPAIATAIEQARLEGVWTHYRVYTFQNEGVI